MSLKEEGAVGAPASESSRLAGDAAEHLPSPLRVPCDWCENTDRRRFCSRSGERATESACEASATSFCKAAWRPPLHRLKRAGSVFDRDSREPAPSSASRGGAGASGSPARFSATASTGQVVAGMARDGQGAIRARTAILIKIRMKASRLCTCRQVIGQASTSLDGVRQAADCPRSFPSCASDA